MATGAGAAVAACVRAPSSATAKTEACVACRWRAADARPAGIGGYSLPGTR